MGRFPATATRFFALKFGFDIFRAVTMLRAVASEKLLGEIGGLSGEFVSSVTF
jgi:hypothetical protein